MAIPSYGTAGTEVLYRTTIKTQVADATSFRWDRTNATTGTETYAVAADHIVTVLSMTFCNNVGGHKDLYLKLNDGAGDVFLITPTSIPAYGIFVWNDKFVLVPGDKVIVFSVAGADMDCWCTYIDQAF